jgi:hypothetical protein
MASSFTRCVHHKQRPTTVGRTPLGEWSARRRGLYNTQHSQGTNSYDPGGIRTRIPNKQAAADPKRPIPRGHRDRSLLKVSHEYQQLSENRWIIFSVLCSSFRASWINSKKFQPDGTLVQDFINSCKSLYMFRAKQSPINRSSIKLYLQHLVFINGVCPAVVVDESFRLYKSVTSLEFFGIIFGVLKMYLVAFSLIYLLFIWSSSLASL